MANFMVGEKKDKNMLQYFMERYNVKVEKQNQPLLKASLNQKRTSKEEESTVFLVPELMLICGLPDDFDEFKRREVSSKTIIEAWEKEKRISNLVNSFKSLGDFSPQTVSQSLDLKIS